jgi:DNA-binding winged helix-turn-helix (wHTH) protein
MTMFDINEPSYAFGRFRALPRSRVLLADGVPVELGNRAFDVLMALIEAKGALVSKDELLDRVWHGTIVEESNLHVQVSALRKALGGDRDIILTVSGRGYRFTAPVRAVTAAAAVASDGDRQPLDIHVLAPSAELVAGSAAADLARDDHVALGRVVTALRVKRIVFVLDDCERVAGGLALAVELLLHAAHARVLASDRQDGRREQENSNSKRNSPRLAARPRSPSHALRRRHHHRTLSAM